MPPDDLATIIYTSGTTGAPKGVALTHANYELNLRELPNLLHIEREPVLTLLQPWHALERQMQLMYLSKGCCIHYSNVLHLRGDLTTVRPVVMATVPELWVKLYKGVFLRIDGLKPARRRLARWLVARSLTYARARRTLEGREPEVRPHGPVRRAVGRASARTKVVTLAPFHALADRLVFREVRAGLGGRLRFPCVGGGPLPDAVDEFFDAAGMPLLEGYGMTEAIVVIAMRDPHHRMLRTTGHVIRGMEHRLADEGGSPCRPGDVGRLQVRGPNIMRGYYKDPERTAEVLGDDGWFDTRDLALVHADGSLRVIGRLDDTLVLTNGENVNAPYLENELCASEWIDRAVVVGEGKPYLAALVVPSLSHLEGLARSLGLATGQPGGARHRRARPQALPRSGARHQRRPPPLRALRARAPRAPVARGVPHRPRALADAQAAAARVPAPVLRRDRRAVLAVSAGRRGPARVIAVAAALVVGGGARLVAVR